MLARAKRIAYLRRNNDCVLRGLFPACHTPRVLLILVKKSPGHDPALLLPLSHLYRFVMQRTRIFQRAINAGQAGRLRDQRGKPHTAARKPRTFRYHAAHKSLLATLTAKLHTLPAEIQHRYFFLVGLSAKILPFALRA